MYTSFSVPTPAKPTSIRCGGKIARCNVPDATATTSICGAITTTDQGVNATGATAASAPSTISRTPCSIRVSGRYRTGFWSPFCSVWRARLAASPEWFAALAPCCVARHGIKARRAGPVFQSHPRTGVSSPTRCHTTPPPVRSRPPSTASPASRRSTSADC
jgi:hypothetical protein